MGGCTAYVKCCMCDDSVGHKHAIRKFEELLTNRIEQNNGTDDMFVVHVSPQRRVGFVELETALGGLELVRQMQSEMTALKGGRTW